MCRHFADKREEDTLVVGLYGDWGCGKTAGLRRLEKLVGDNMADEKGDEITVPVFFNA